MRRSPNCISVGDTVLIDHVASHPDAPMREYAEVVSCPSGEDTLWEAQTGTLRREKLQRHEFEVIP